MSLQYHGRAAFREAIARDLDHARLLTETVQQQPELELLAPVPLSAVCFRHRTQRRDPAARQRARQGVPVERDDP
jgi:glutamate/tyrosine decarboxylase-like PLP-dependent enzyme